MTEPVQGGHVSPELKARYHQDFEKGVGLFKDTLIAYAMSDNAEQKVKFKEVMDKALDVMNKSARGCLSAGEQQKEARIEDDYQAFLKDSNPSTYKQLADDLEEFGGPA